MPARKMRVEIFDNDGNRYTVMFEGRITREKAVQMLDLVELLGGMPNDSAQWEKNVAGKISKFEQMRSIVERHFPFVWFSSRDVRECYEQKFHQPIGLSTISTYLSRMADKGYLARGGRLNSRQYKLVVQNALSSIKDK